MSLLPKILDVSVLFKTFMTLPDMHHCTATETEVRVHQPFLYGSLISPSTDVWSDLNCANLKFEQITGTVSLYAGNKLFYYC